MSRPVVLALPGIALGVAGLFHPMHLTAATAHTWWTLHVPGLFLFPLVGVALMALVRGRRDPVALLVVLTAFGYATCYTALDVVRGIAAGYVVDRVGPALRGRSPCTTCSRSARRSAGPARSRSS